MGIYIANCVIKLMAKQDIAINKANVLVLGVTFKEDCPDIRNSRVVDVVSELKSFGTQVEIYDPHADAHEVLHEYGLKTISSPDKKYDAIVLAVGHKEFRDLNWQNIKHDRTVIYDVKGFLDQSMVTARL